MTLDIPSDLATDSLLEAMAQGRALPSRWYTDETVFRIEQERILRKSWQFAAHSEQLNEPGDVVLTDVGGVPIVLTRSSDGIHGFINICRHRAHPVVVEEGRRVRETLQCMYHGWTYGFDGTLLRAPRAESESMQIEPADCSLMPVQTHIWGPTIWVNVDMTGPTFSEWAPGLAESVESNGIDVDDHVFAFERTFEVHSNWKVFLDNAIECYHCPTCHSQLSSVLVMNPHRQKLTIGGRFWSTHQIPFRDDERQYFFHWIFPTTYFQYAGAGFDIGAIEIVGVDSIIFRSVTFVPSGTTESAINDLALKLDASPTIHEDVAICERVQKAHAVDVAPPGRLLPGSEQLVLHYQKAILEMIGSGR